MPDTEPVAATAESPRWTALKEVLGRYAFSAHHWDGIEAQLAAITAPGRWMLIERNRITGEHFAQLPGGDGLEGVLDAWAATLDVYEGWTPHRVVDLDTGEPVAFTLRLSILPTPS